MEILHISNNQQMLLYLEGFFYNPNIQPQEEYQKRLTAQKHVLERMNFSDVNLIEGEYTVVKTARAFKNALSRNQNIYLYNDIDFDEDEINFGDYSGTILGNGYTVSNFTIGYDDSRTGLKGELTDLSEIYHKIRAVRPPSSSMTRDSTTYGWLFRVVSTSSG